MSRAKHTCFSRDTPLKLSFFRRYTTWHSSNFYSTDSAHLGTHLEMKIEKSQKKNFLARKEGPLKIDRQANLNNSITNFNIMKFIIFKFFGYWLSHIIVKTKTIC